MRDRTAYILFTALMSVGIGTVVATGISGGVW